MARLNDLVVDCAHPASLARFWAALLDGYEVAPYDETELERLRSKGIDDPEDDPSVLVEARESPHALRLWFQLVPEPEPKSTKNRLHVDVFTVDVAAEVGRLVNLGARVLASPGPDQDNAILADLEGNEFCVFPEG